LAQLQPKSRVEIEMRKQNLKSKEGVINEDTI
jgi:hypothetical protein